jgi:hypothetical protein
MDLKVRNRGLIEVLFPHFSGGTKETMRILSQDSDIPIEIRTENL